MSSVEDCSQLSIVSSFEIRKKLVIEVYLKSAGIWFVSKVVDVDGSKHFDVFVHQTDRDRARGVCWEAERAMRAIGAAVAKRTILGEPE